jgi:Carboxypeptidase regulatory-like domain
LVTQEAPPAHPIVARRASPVVNATLAAILGLGVPANALNVDVSAAQLLVRSDADGKSARTPFGGGEAVVGGTVFDPQGAVIPNAVVKLISDAGAELETKTSSEGEFSFAQVPYGAYIMLVEAQRFYTHVNSNVIVDTPYDTRFEVTMRSIQREVIMGAMARYGE